MLFFCFFQCFVWVNVWKSREQRKYLFFYLRFREGLGEIYFYRFFVWLNLGRKYKWLYVQFGIWDVLFSVVRRWLLQGLVWQVQMQSFFFQVSGEQQVGFLFGQFYKVFISFQQIAVFVGFYFFVNRSGFLLWISIRVYFLFLFLGSRRFWLYFGRRGFFRIFCGLEYGGIFQEVLLVVG